MAGHVAAVRGHATKGHHFSPSPRIKNMLDLSAPPTSNLYPHLPTTSTSPRLGIHGRKPFSLYSLASSNFFDFAAGVMVVVDVVDVRPPVVEVEVDETRNTSIEYLIVTVDDFFLKA